MDRLSRRDLEGVVKFLGDIAGIPLDDAYGGQVLRRLQALIRCDAITYQEYQYRERRHLLLTGIEPEGEFAWDASGTEPPDPDDDLYWDLGPCSIVEYRAENSALTALRMSDVMPPRRFHDMPVYADYFRPHDVEFMLDLGLALGESRQRSLCLFRGNADTDFSERDRAVLELLRPQFLQRERMAALHRQLIDLLRSPAAADDPCGRATLTAREREIVELVAQGKTNAEIAAQLWVAPSTVKKHLENVYVKSGIARRAGVVGLLHPLDRAAQPPFGSTSPAS